MMALQKIAGVFTVGEELIDNGSAFVSGAVDGFLLRAGGDAGPFIFLVKNIGIPVASIWVRQIPKGLVHHAVGQIGMAVVLIALPK